MILDRLVDQMAKTGNTLTHNDFGEQLGLDRGSDERNGLVSHPAGFDTNLRGTMLFQPASDLDQVGHFDTEGPSSSGYDHLLQQPRAVIAPGISVERQIRGKHLLSPVESVRNRLRSCALSLVVKNDGGRHSIGCAYGPEPERIGH